MLPHSGPVTISASATLESVAITGVPTPSDSRSTPGTPSKSEVSSVTAAPAIAGSLQYTAPEYFLADGVASERSDLFSLAVLTYQMLCGQLPYGLQVTQVRTAADLRRLRYVPVRHWRPELPDWLDAVLHKALQVDPARRQTGAGRALIEATYREADARGATRTYWTTQEFNYTARALYDQLATKSVFVQYRR